MREIYTNLTPSEVKGALHTAANAAGDAFAVQEISKELGTIYKSNQVADVGKAKHYIHLVDGMTVNALWKIITKTTTGVHMKNLVSHQNNEVRLSATFVLVKLRSSWARHKVESRCA